MLRNVKIGTKILVIMLTTTLSALLIIALISYIQMLNLTKYSQAANINLGVTASEKSRQALLDQAEEYLSKIAVEQAGNSNAVLAQVETEVTEMANYMTMLYADSENFTGEIPPLPNETENGLASAKYIFAPGVEVTSELHQELKLISNAKYMFSAILENDSTIDNTYLGTKSGISYRYSRSNSYNPDYDPRKRDWYTAAMASQGDTLWVDTYLDAYNQICVTCCATFNDSEGKPIGVVATDITLNKLKEDILSTRIGRGGYAFLMDEKGVYIAHPDYDKEGFETRPLDRAEGNWLTTLNAMLSGKSGVSTANIDGVESYIAYSQLNSTAWTLAVTVPINELTLPADETKEEINIYTNESLIHIEETLSNVLKLFIILFAICTMIFIVFSFVLSNAITKPIKCLTQDICYIGEGNFDRSIEVTSNNEVGKLTEAVNTMAKKLKLYISNITDTAIQNERRDSTFAVATDIQKDMMTCPCSTISDLRKVDVWAEMIIDKEAGGNFYDAFFLDETCTKFCMVIADVNGKGIHTSVFAAIAKKLIKTHILLSDSLLDAMTKVNRSLCTDNYYALHVTAFVAVLDVNTNRLNYVNCGHTSPLISKDHKGFEYMNINEALALGMQENYQYRTESTTLSPGDMIALYSKGLTQAINGDETLFGKKALQETLNACAGMSTKAVVDQITDTLDAFTCDVEQSDDMTMLLVRYLGEG